MRETTSPEFIEAIARGFDVIKSFSDARPLLSLSEVASEAGLARPTARRILITLVELGYVRSLESKFMLTPRVLELGLSYFAGQPFWQTCMPRLEDLVASTHESSSLAQLDGSDVVYVARAAVPKLVALSVTIGTRFPAAATSLGKVLLAALSDAELDAVLDTPSRAGVTASVHLSRPELDVALAEVRARGWALADQELAPAIRSIAVPIRLPGGEVFAALNVNAHAAETSIEQLVGVFLPQLLETAACLESDLANLRAFPTSDVDAGR
ncbi:IclR family transcriptional regulator C-terminal domain-containing protein [Microbacterium sp. NPDC089189]|uniref:IclR family transcriptional regulator domain-containing protein n=1 Tax=Microbacterium sp. NPDC089189 TaxID=3154972 RepID=UPI00344100B1